ncbi:MAG: hypothetical protein J3R72DRAFT_460360 [Linnemannia gamsii]|nr:MAG: hypothetical protein J3R72DRAFT_460360 [Linnemannia gamsii]
MTSPSFPIGLGLTAAAHVYLSNLSWRKTAKGERRYNSHYRTFKAHVLSLSLRDLDALTANIKLLNANIENIERTLQASGRPSTDDLEYISIKEIKQWIEFYSMFWKERGHMIQDFAQEIARTDVNYIDLRTNQVCTYLLSTAIALRYALSTEPAARFMNKHLPRVYRFGSWIAQGLGVNTSAALKPTQVSTLTGGTALGDTWGSLLFQLAPTLFLSGIHFVAGVRCQWVIRRLQHDREPQLLFVKRLFVVTMLLNLRQSRLEWLLRINEACEDFQRKREVAGDSREVGQDEIDAAREPGCKPPRPSTHDRLRILAEDPTSQVYALLNNTHDGLLFEFMNHNNNSGDLSRPSPLQAEQLSFGPDLERVDTAQFLGDPRERLRIMKLEFMAMKNELELFRELFVLPKK